MNGPLGDETKVNQHLAISVILISCETEELEEAYKILMLMRVDLIFMVPRYKALWTKVLWQRYCG